jgi:6-phosphogluconate dehydrogenase
VVFASGETPFAAALAAQVFGAHTYQRVDDAPGTPPHHTNWTGAGGRVASSTYTV